MANKSFGEAIVDAAQALVLTASMVGNVMTIAGVDIGKKVDQLNLDYGGQSAHDIRDEISEELYQELARRGHHRTSKNIT